MINKILQSTRGKPCSCPEGKQCEASKLKKALKPQIYVEEPHRLPIPIVISHYKYKKPTTVNTSTESRWPFRNKKKDNHDTPQTSPLCRWYRKKRALHRYKVEHEKEQKRLHKEKLEKARKQREEEILELLIKQEQYKQERDVKPTVTSYVKTKKVRIGRSSSAKPQTIPKHVTVKRKERYLPFSERFVNCVYRACCQFYCYLSLLVVLTFAIIVFI